MVIYLYILVLIDQVFSASWSWLSIFLPGFDCNALIFTDFNSSICQLFFRAALYVLSIASLYRTSYACFSSKTANFLIYEFVHFFPFPFVLRLAIYPSVVGWTLTSCVWRPCISCCPILVVKNRWLGEIGSGNAIVCFVLFHLAVEFCP